MTSGPLVISSAANALLKDLRRLAQDSTAYRKQGRVWLEGDHLCRAALARGVRPEMVVAQESAWELLRHEFGTAAPKLVIVADALFASLSTLESPGHMAIIIAAGEPQTARPGVASVVLDGLQDAGNVGTILRCAAAFGFHQVIALKGTVALWSPKVLRAGMGAHFGLTLVEGAQVSDVVALGIPLLATSSHRGEYLHLAKLPWPCAWLLGHEGQGVSSALAESAKMEVRIAQPGGEESLNVATAAAICLHASATAGK